MTRAKDISKIVSDANFGGTLDVAGETTLATHLNMGDGDVIAYADVTEADAIGWAKDALGEEQVTAIEENIASQIALMKTPTTATGVSW